MPTPSIRLLQALKPLRSSYSFSSSSPAVYSIGLSYAGKDSPPFVPPRSQYPRTGFAHLPTGKSDRIREWVRRSGDIPAGRGELQSAVVGGWTKEAMESVRKWGAGEDFFSIEAPGLEQSVSGAMCKRLADRRNGRPEDVRLNAGHIPPAGREQEGRPIDAPCNL